MFLKVLVLNFVKIVRVVERNDRNVDCLDHFTFFFVDRLANCDVVGPECRKKITPPIFVSISDVISNDKFGRKVCMSSLNYLVPKTFFTKW